jgi:Zn-dependent peptidase ImmA (M78 family)
MPVRVPVSPDVLEWALDRTQDPEAITHAMPKVLEWMAGDSQPTVKQLTSFAARTGTPFGYLLLQRPPALDLPVPDFREGFDGETLGDPSPDLLAVVHQSIRRQDWYRDYAVDNALPEVDVVGSAEGMSATEAAATMRETLGYDVAQRRGNWNDQRRYLLHAFEDLGGLTVATSMVENNTHRMLDPDEFRGFSLIDPLAPLVFINTRQTINGQIFTLAHEFAHVWRGVGGVSLEDMRWRPQSRVERWCNDVASEFLVPTAHLRQRYPDVRRLKLVEQLEALARTYKCGTLVVLQALNRTGLRRFDDYEATYDAEVKRLRALAEDRDDAGGQGQFLYNQPYRIGERFSRAIIDDAMGGRTTLSEAVRLTSLKSLTNFDNYAAYLSGRASA